ncbi:MAG: 6-phosphogluconolactonase [Gammaproteobacteria bacterium]|nr:6-phosphogluconolactonase [Gammaproteobacteria bacterium]
MINHLEFGDREEQAEVLARVIAAQLRAAIKARDNASLVVSGGSTPIAMFNTLSTLEIPWSNVTVLLADERWVPPDHPDSNQALVEKHLLQNAAASARFVPLWNDATSLDANIAACNKSLTQHARTFDVVVLGMGDDGHTASLFPCAPPAELADALAPHHNESCMAMHPSYAPHARITLSYPRLLDTRRLLLQICGEKKQQVLAEALGGSDIGAMPVRAFLKQHERPLDIYFSA